MAQERLKSQSTSTLGTSEGGEPGGCYDEIIKYIAHLWRRANRKWIYWFQKRFGRRQHKVVPHKAISLRRKRQMKKEQGEEQNQHRPQCRHHHRRHRYNSDSPTAPRASPELSDIDPLASPRRPTCMAPHNGVSDNRPMGSLVQIAEQRPQQCLSSSNHVPTATVARASSFNSDRRVNITCPELLAVTGARNAALIAAASMAGVDCSKLNPFLCK